MAEKNTQAVARQDKATPAEIAANTLIPPVDIWEDKEGVTLFADLAGVGKDGLDVHVDKDTLLISGKRTVKEETEDGSNYTEMPVRDYYRAFTIGDEIDREKPVVMYCKVGIRSTEAILHLQNIYAFNNLYNLKGGINAWAAEIDNKFVQ